MQLDFIAELISECCKDVSTPPVLQQPTGETLPLSAIQSNEACVNVVAQGFWVKGKVVHTDVKGFNPTAKVY